MSNVSRQEAVHSLFENETLLREGAELRKSPPIVMFVHALNPFGFHFGRRVNEHNVDLNRNYKSKGQWEAMASLDANAFGYEELDAFMNPRYDLENVVAVSEALPSSLFVRGVWVAWYYWTFFFNAIYHLITYASSFSTNETIFHAC